MTQDPQAKANFIVESTEEVTVIVTVNPSEAPCVTRAARDSKAVIATSANPDTYTFTVTGEPGSVSKFNCECLFDNAPDGTHYGTVVKGSRGGSFSIYDTYAGGQESFGLRFVVSENPAVSANQGGL